MVTPGVIYSDFDGVHNVPHREGLLTAQISTVDSRFFKDETEIAWNGDTLQLFLDFISASGFDLEWLTTWNEGGLIHRAAQGMNFPHLNHVTVTLNGKARSKREWTHWKAAHIISDQRANPRPFIWIDDKAPYFWGEAVAQSTTAPSLIIPTDSIEGLTRQEILSMVTWLEGLKCPNDKMTEKEG